MFNSKLNGILINRDDQKWLQEELMNFMFTVFPFRYFYAGLSLMAF